MEYLYTIVKVVVSITAGIRQTLTSQYKFNLFYF